MLDINSIDKNIAKILYQNASLKEATIRDVEKSDLNLCKEELLAIMGERPFMPSIDNLIRVIRFIDRCGFDPEKIVIWRKVQDNAGVAYEVGWTDSTRIFTVNIEEETTLSTNESPVVMAHVGIVVDMD